MPRALAFLLGLAAAVTGVAMVSVPAACIAGGLSLMLGAAGLEVAAQRRPAPKRSEAAR